MKKPLLIWLVVLLVTCCSGTDERSCPGHEEMIQLDSGWCMDRYESSMWETADCTGQQYGLVGECEHLEDGGLPGEWMTDDYPAGFPDLVESDGCSGGCEDYVGELDWIEIVPQETPVYACSLEGVVPAKYLSWFQAKRACENSGKVLCPIEVWRAACSNGGKRNYPYGGDPTAGDTDGYDPSACNGVEYDGVDPQSLGTPQNTGDAASCEGGKHGLFDLSGNVAEYVLSPIGPAGECELAGGYHDLGAGSLTCESTITDFIGTSLDTCFGAGVRCCLEIAD